MLFRSSDNAADLVNDGLAITVPDSQFNQDWLAEQLPTALERAQRLNTSVQSEAGVLNRSAAKRIAELALAEVAK